MLKKVGKYGIILGMVNVIILLTAYFFKISSYSNITSAINIAIVFGLFMSLRHARENVYNGYMSYGEALGNGTLIMLIALFIYSLALYGVLKFDGNLFDYIIGEMQNVYIDSGFDEEQVEDLFEVIRMYMTPGIYIISNFIGLFINGFIFLLIIAIFVKRKKPFFEA